MAALPIILLAGATAIQTVGAIRQGQAAQNAASYNASIARQNQGIAQQQGEMAVYRQQRDAQRKIGSAAAGFNASGLDTSTGSPLDILRSSAEQASLDASSIRYNYALKGLGYQQTAMAEEYSGKMAKQNSYYSAAGTLLGGGARVAKGLLD